MAMTIQQAQMEAMRLRARRPELQNMAVSDLIEQIMASEGMGEPGAGGGTLADIFQPARVITPSSPAPMEAVRLQAPKPTADIVPGADAVRQKALMPTTGEYGELRVPRDQDRPLTEAQKEDIARIQAGARAPEEAAAVPVRAASPVAAALAAAEAPAKVAPSRYRPMLEQAQAELEQLDAQQQAIKAQGKEAPPELVSKFENLSGKVSQLKNLVAAEEGAVVSAERTAVLERQTQRLSREKELVEEARKRAPFDALIAGGAALASARPGESFTSALTRGLQAGSQSYTGARDAREVGLRGIEERRDALILQNEDAIEKARADAIALAKTGVEMDAQQMALTKLGRDDVKALATQKADIDLANANASKATTEAAYAPRILDADLALTRARTADALRPPASGGGGATGTKPTGSVYSAIQSRINKISTLLSDPYTSDADKAELRAEMAQKKRELAYYGSLLGINVPAPAAPAKAAPAKAAPAASKPPVKGARWSSAKKGWFIPDPDRPGKYLQVFN